MDGGKIASIGYNEAVSQLCLAEGSHKGDLQRREAREQGRRDLQGRLAAAADQARHHPAASAALTLAVAYVGVRASVAVFHRVRRAFLRQLLLDVSAALDRIGQRYWLDFGSLLGIRREGDLILHDNDVDLPVLNPDWETLVEGLHRELPKNKYSVKVVVPAEGAKSTWVRVYCPMAMCDLFGAWEEETHIFVDCGHGDTMRIPKDLILPTGKMTWKGRSFNAPHQVEKTLEFRYGKDWRTPAYMQKGADTVEGNKLYARIFRALAKIGIRI